MVDTITVELELDEERHGELCQEADRLGLTPGEVARRAVAMWLTETEEDFVEAETV